MANHELTMNYVNLFSWMFTVRDSLPVFYLEYQVSAAFCKVLADLKKKINNNNIKKEKENPQTKLEHGERGLSTSGVCEKSQVNRAHRSRERSSS